MENQEKNNKDETKDNKKRHKKFLFTGASQNEPVETKKETPNRSAPNTTTSSQKNTQEGWNAPKENQQPLQNQSRRPQQSQAVEQPKKRDEDPQQTNQQSSVNYRSKILTFSTSNASSKEEEEGFEEYNPGILLNKIIQEKQQSSVIKSIEGSLAQVSSEKRYPFDEALLESIYKNNIPLFSSHITSNITNETVGSLMTTVVHSIAHMNQFMIEAFNEELINTIQAENVDTSLLNAYLNTIASYHSPKYAATTLNTMLKMERLGAHRISGEYVLNSLRQVFDSTVDTLESYTRLVDEFEFCTETLTKALKQRKGEEQSSKESFTVQHLRYLNNDILSKVSNRLTYIGRRNKHLKMRVKKLLSDYYASIDISMFSRLLEVSDIDMWSGEGLINYFVHYSSHIDSANGVVLLDVSSLQEFFEFYARQSDRVQFNIINEMYSLLVHGRSNHLFSKDFRITASPIDVRALHRKAATLELLKNNGLYKLVMSYLAKETSSFKILDDLKKSWHGSDHRSDILLFDAISNYHLLGNQLEGPRFLQANLKSLANNLISNRTDFLARTPLSPVANVDLLERGLLPILTGNNPSAGAAHITTKYINPIISYVMYRKISSFFTEVIENSYPPLTIFKMHKNHIAVMNVVRDQANNRDFCQLYDNCLTNNYKDRKIAQTADFLEATDYLMMNRLIPREDVMEKAIALNNFLFKLPQKEYLKLKAEKEKREIERKAFLESKGIPVNDDEEKPQQASPVEEGAKEATGEEDKGEKTEVEKKKKIVQQDPYTYKAKPYSIQFSELEKKELPVKFFNNPRLRAIMDHFCVNQSQESMNKIRVDVPQEYYGLASYLISTACKTKSIEILVLGERLCGVLNIRLDNDLREKYIEMKRVISLDIGMCDVTIYRPSKEVHAMYRGYRRVD